TATGGPTNNPVTFATNAACTVTGAGTAVTMNHAGACTVTAPQDGNDDYNAATTTQTVDVGKGDQKVDFAPVTGATVGHSATLQATSTSGLPVTFTTDPSPTNDACTVTGSTVTFVHARPCDVTATQAGNDDYTGATASQRITIGRGDQKITFTSTPPSPARVGNTYTATATSTSGLPVTFSAD